MTMKISWMALCLGVSLILASCTKDEVDVLHGSWRITAASVEQDVLGKLEATKASGTVNFNEDGTGSLNYSFSAEGLSASSSGPFTWVATSDRITLNGGTAEEVNWQRLENKNKKQVIQFTDTDAQQGGAVTITLTLEK